MNVLALNQKVLGRIDSYAELNESNKWRMSEQKEYSKIEDLSSWSGRYFLCSNTPSRGLPLMDLPTHQQTSQTLKILFGQAFSEDVS